jgi:hypothetical protein
MHMLAALDLATGKLYYRIRPRKHWREFLSLLKALRARWPREKLYVVLDNFSPHKHAEVRTWAADNDAELVFLPTYGFWLDWIESDFAALRYFALNGTDHRTQCTGQGTRSCGKRPSRLSSSPSARSWPPPGKAVRARTRSWDPRSFSVERLGAGR